MGCGSSRSTDVNRNLNYFYKMPNKKMLAGKNAVVTGGNRGLGKEIVEIFADQGANIVFNSSAQNPKAEEFAKQISTTYGVECYYIPCNVRNEKEIDQMVKFAKQKLKRIDILINNAGKAFFGDVENLSLDDYNECMEINLYAPFLFCQKIVPIMKENKWGRIVNFTSGTTKIIQPNLGAYVAAKNGINALTSVLAREVGEESNITVNCLVPGPMDTDMFNNGVNGFAQSLNVSPDMIKKNIFSEQVVKEPVHPRRLAEITLFMCTEQSGNVTGALYPVDNGFTC